jgi:hypothetical protein
MWRDLRRLLVCEPELTPIHPRFFSEALNRNLWLTPAILSVGTLGRAASSTDG